MELSHRSENPSPTHIISSQIVLLLPNKPGIMPPLDSATLSGLDGPGLIAYDFFCIFGMMFFVEGLALFCAGITSTKSALSQLSYSLVVSCMVMIQYYTVGYSLISSDVTGAGNENSLNWGNFVGNFHYAFFRNIDWENPVEISQVLLKYGFAVVPACLIASAACQRGRFIPLLVFVAVWMTMVYCPVAYWCWHQHGWSRTLGALDYAGGTIIHITSGFGALVYSLVLGPRVVYDNPSDEDPPYSLSMVIRGSMMMWLGWIGFTGGSQMSDVPSALLSVVNTLLSAAMGGFSWMILDYVVTEHQRLLFKQQNGAMTSNYDESEESQLSLVSFCSGVISGLVTITPGAGFVSPSAAIIFGLLGGIGCNFSTKLKFFVGIDDPLDVFAVHGMGGMIGTVLTGVFAKSKYTVRGQILIQLLSAFSAAAYTLGCTLVIAVAIDSIPWLSLRVPISQEYLGTDLLEHGETSNIAAPTNLDNGYYMSRHEGVSMDRTRLTQTNQNAPMYPGSFDHPLLQRLPLSYGNYTNSGEN